MFVPGVASTVVGFMKMQYDQPHSVLWPAGMPFIGLLASFSDWEVAHIWVSTANMSSTISTTEVTKAFFGRNLLFFLPPLCGIAFSGALSFFPEVFLSAISTLNHFLFRGQRSIAR